MKLYFIPFILIFIAALGSTDYSKNNISSFYADTTLKCPVTGDDITGEYVSLKYIDKEIKFCNDGCVMAFKKEPAKYTELCTVCHAEIQTQNMISVQCMME
jgi:YHS domain-containing protein